MILWQPYCFKWIAGQSFPVHRTRRGYRNKPVLLPGQILRFDLVLETRRHQYWGSKKSNLGLRGHPVFSESDRERKTKSSQFVRSGEPKFSSINWVQPVFSPFFFAFGRRLSLAIHLTALIRCLRSMNKKLLVDIRPWYGDHSSIGVLR